MANAASEIRNTQNAEENDILMVLGRKEATHLKMAASLSFLLTLGKFWMQRP